MIRRPIQSRRAVVALTALASTTVLSHGAASPAAADWPAPLAGIAQRIGLTTAAKSAGTLDTIALTLKSRAAPPNGAILAAHASAEGHWTFVNAAGERFTAGTPDELKRMPAVLAPEAAGSEARLTLILTEDTVFNQRAALKDLPRLATLMMGYQTEAYPLSRRTLGGQERMFAEVRPNLVVEIDARGGDGAVTRQQNDARGVGGAATRQLDARRLFDEVAWQLARPLDRANIRVLALEPGGPQALTPSPKFDPLTKRALTDVIDPVKLAPSLRAIARQTAIISGRIDGELLWFRPSLGTERSLVMKDLMAAAEAADVNLIVLRSSAPRQPGARNWLWQRVSVDGLDAALERPHLADFLNALGLGQNKLMVTASDGGGARVSLKAVPVKAEGATLSGLTEIFTDIVSDVAGKVVTSGMEANMMAADRQRELESRLIPGVPSLLQTVYLGLFLLGLVGLAVARRWWDAIWPNETRDGYENTAGYLAAHAVRLTLFTLLFMPAVALVSAPLALSRPASIVRALTSPFTPLRGRA